MKIVNEISADEMVSIFLNAELNSKRWKRRIFKIIRDIGTDKKIIEEPDINNKKENQIRKNILGEFRGYGNNTKLFTNFPKNIKWYRVVLTKSELKKVKYINYSYWNELSSGTRLPTRAVENIKKGKTVFGEKNDQFFELAGFIDKGFIFPEIIVNCDRNWKNLKLLEGHVRLTSYFLAKNPPKDLRVIVGKVQED